jgi:predicted O-methyltransferase YrrM
MGWFKKKEKQEHKVLRQAAERGGKVTPEYHRATPECPHPERWSMLDSMTAEVEVLEFLQSLVLALKPELIVETGTFRGISTIRKASLEMNVKGTIDLFFSDSDLPIREQEVRRFLPQINPHGLILMHDASSHLRQVREAALRLEQEGLISVVLLPTPRGLVVAQKRAGRK